MNTMKPFFTVIIPTFNRREILKGAVRSVLDQKFEDFEIIIVDDHSTDGTSEIIPLFKDDRIRYVVNYHSKGLSGARNTGMDMANGTWTAFLDDDDIWLPEKLERVHERIAELDGQTGLIYTGFSYFDPCVKKAGIQAKVPSKEGWVQKELLYKNFIGTPSVVTVRTDLLRIAGGCDESFCYYEDGDLYVRIAGLSKVAFITDALTYVRTSNRDRLSFKYDRRLLGYKRFLEKHRALLDKSPRLRHRASSRVFAYALLQGKISDALSVLPWTLAGIAVDMRNVVWIVALLTYPIRRKLRLSSEQA